MITVRTQDSFTYLALLYGGQEVDLGVWLDWTVLCARNLHFAAARLDLLLWPQGHEGSGHVQILNSNWLLRGHMGFSYIFLIGKYYGSLISISRGGLECYNVNQARHITV